jgi:hypothetical protein
MRVSALLLAVILRSLYAVAQQKGKETNWHSADSRLAAYCIGDQTLQLTS